MAACALSPLLAAATPAVPQQAQLPQLTLRNVTGTPVAYRIGLSGAVAGGPVSQRTLAPGAIDRFSTTEVVRVWFRKRARIVVYSLQPRQAYSFRLDADGELELYGGSHGREDAPDLAPWVPTPMDVVVVMLELAELTGEDVVFDLGCGDGRIVIAAAELFGARGVGVDIDPQRIREANEAARVARVEPRVEFRVEDATRTDVSSATVLGLYLLEESLGLLRPRLERELRRGARVVSLNYPVPGWEPTTLREVRSGGEDFVVYLYRR